MSAAPHQSSVWESLCFAFCTPVAALSSMALKLPCQSPLLSPPVKGLPIVWKLFLLYSFLPEVQVPSLFFCLCFFFFLLPYPGTWGVSCLLGGLRSSASVQWVFCGSCSTCRCNFDVFVGRKVISTFYSSAILKVPPPFFLKLNNTPLSRYALIYLSIHLLKNILVAFKF